VFFFSSSKSLLSAHLFEDENENENEDDDVSVAALSQRTCDMPLV
jgi:hypothetical protein